MSELPGTSSGFIPDPLPEPGHGQPARVITHGEILYLSLDLQPSLYGSVPRVVPEGDGDLS